MAGLFNVFEPEEMDDGDIVNVFTFAIGSRSWSLPGYGMVVMEKRLAAKCSMQLVSMQWMICCAMVVHAG